MSVSISSLIPFQPGLNLGSIVKGDVIEKMEKHQQSSSQIERFEKELRSIEEGLQLLQSKKDSLLKEKGARSEKDLKKNSCAKTLWKAYQTQEDLLNKKLEQLAQEQLEFPEEAPFSNIYTGLTGPINFQKSTIDIDSNRGFDTITYFSQHIDMRQDISSLKKQLSETSRSGKVSLGASYSVISGKASFGLSDAAANRVEEIHQSGKASSVLLINAVVTTRKTRFFSQLKYDKLKLKEIFRAMLRDQEKKTDEPGELGITADIEKVEGDAVKRIHQRIYMLTEASMGGSFSGIVTFYKQDKFEELAEDEAKERALNLELKIKAKFLGAKVQVGGEYHDSSRQEDHSNILKSRSNLNVTVEFISQGVVPKDVRNKVVVETHKYKDPELAASEKDFKKSLTKAVSELPHVISQDEAVSVHTPKTILKAYEGFSRQIANDPQAGVPIGFFCTALGIEEIEDRLKKSGIDTDKIRREMEVNPLMVKPKSKKSKSANTN